MSDSLPSGAKRRATLADYWETHSPQLLELGSRPVVEALVGSAGVAAGAKGLNVMCRTGEAACRLASLANVQMVGVDPDPANVEAARRMAKMQNVADRTTFQSVSSEALPWEAGEFDFVYGDRVGALPHLVNFCRQWVRVCKAGGAIALHELCWLDEPSTAEKERVSALIGGAVYTRSGYLGLLRTVGLQDVSSQLLTERMMVRSDGARSGGIVRSLAKFRLAAVRLSRDHSFISRLLKRGRLGFVLVYGRKPEAGAGATSS